jgi:hypothetical protein
MIAIISLLDLPFLLKKKKKKKKEKRVERQGSFEEITKNVGGTFGTKCRKNMRPTVKWYV